MMSPNIEYLFKHLPGDKLPRGKIFDRYRGVLEKNYTNRDDYEVASLTPKVWHDKNISPFLKIQAAWMDLACVNTNFNVSSSRILDSIQATEDPKIISQKMLKREKSFSSSGFLSGYSHSHVSHPGGYLNAMKKEISNKEFSFQSLPDKNEIIKDVENTISNRGKNRSRKITGYWLIYRSETNSPNVYIGVFPHSSGKMDDIWISKICKYSESLIKSESKLF